MNENEKLKSKIEGMLFLSGEPIEKKHISQFFNIKEKEVERLVNELIKEKSDEKSGIEIVEFDGKYQMVVKKELYDDLVDFFDNRKEYTLSNAALETLSIIAYNDRVTKNQIDDIRGTNSFGVINRLLSFELIKEAGKLDLPGRPMSYDVTDKFYLTFGIKDKSELPELPKIDEEKLEILKKENEENI